MSPPAPFAPPQSWIPSSEPETSREIRPEEEDWLRNRATSPAAGLTRVFGGILGLIALLMGIALFLGFPWDMDVFPIVEISVVVLGLVLAAVSSSIRAPVVNALKDGEVTEVQAVPVWGNPTSDELQPVQFGQYNLMVPRDMASTMLGPQRLGWISSNLPGRATVGKKKILFLSVNGALPPRPWTGFMLG